VRTGDIELRKAVELENKKYKEVQKNKKKKRLIEEQLASDPSTSYLMIQPCSVLLLLTIIPHTISSYGLSSTRR
jgi:hypothetical protein